MIPRIYGYVASALILAFASGLAAAAPKRLNNLVTELVRLEKVVIANNPDIAFTNPRNGWIYISTSPSATGTVEIVLGDASILRADAQTGASETMRNLPQGEHRLTLRGEGAVDSLIIRAMPETHFVRYPQEPRYPELGSFDWPWLKENVLSSVNTLVGFPKQIDDAIIEEWTGSGRKLISYGHLPYTKGLTGAMAFEHWHEDPGFQDPRLHGMIADEFAGRQHPLYPSWTEGMRMLGEAAAGTGRAFYAYCGGPGMYSRPEARALVRTVFEANFYMAWERYHHEMPTEAEGRAFMDELLGDEIVRWKRVFPDCQRQMVLVLGIFSTGPDIDVRPDVDYKVWMDMQMQYLATHPEFDGLFGVHFWYSGAADEETLRWESALYRHYGIEGNTELLSKSLGWTYELRHIQNPDFHAEDAGWTMEPAAPESLRTGYLERLAEVQGRYWHRTQVPDDPAGNTYLWMKRQAEKPNRVTQEIKNLAPGRVYTLKAISADYQDIVNGRSFEGTHAVSLNIEGAEVLPEGTYTGVKVRGGSGHAQLPFPDGAPWFNHHQVKFRATSETATLGIGDWATAAEPGGPVGQELMVNYLQLEPYFEVD